MNKYFLMIFDFQSLQRFSRTHKEMFISCLYIVLVQHDKLQLIIINTKGRIHLTVVMLYLQYFSTKTCFLFTIHPQSSSVVFIMQAGDHKSVLGVLQKICDIYLYFFSCKMHF